MFGAHWGENPLRFDPIAQSSLWEELELRQVDGSPHMALGGEIDPMTRLKGWRPGRPATPEEWARLRKRALRIIKLSREFEKHKFPLPESEKANISGDGLSLFCPAKIPRPGNKVFSSKLKKKLTRFFF